jgi:hypothetical protein
MLTLHAKNFSINLPICCIVCQYLWTCLLQCVDVVNTSEKKTNVSVGLRCISNHSRLNVSWPTVTIVCTFSDISVTLATYCKLTADVCVTSEYRQWPL